MKKLIALALALAITGCAWSRGRTRLYSEGELTQDRHCWTIVAGKGKLGAACTPEETTLGSEDTGFSDNAAPTFESIGKVVGAAVSSALKSTAAPAE